MNSAILISMNKKVLITILLLSGVARSNDFQDVRALASKNHLQPPNRVVRAIVRASQWYGIDPLDLTAIGILETNLGKYNHPVYNLNNTVDVGLFQINSINRTKCIKFDLNTIEGSAFCAAKLLSQIRNKYQTNDPEWLGIYHSKTKSHKRIYFDKLTKVMAQVAE